MSSYKYNPFHHDPFDDTGGGGSSGSSDHATLSNLDYAHAGHTGFEPTVTKGDLTAGSTKVTVTGGTNAVIGAGASVDVDESEFLVENLSTSLTGVLYGNGAAIVAAALSYPLIYDDILGTISIQMSPPMFVNPGTGIMTVLRAAPLYVNGSDQLGLLYSTSDFDLNGSFELILKNAYLKLDQTTPQTVANGVPLLNVATSAFTDPKSFVTKEYVDLAISSLKLDEYFSATASPIGGIYYLMDTIPAAAGTVVSATISSNTTTNIFNFVTATGEPHLDRLLAGNYDIHAHLLKTGNRTITAYCELWTRTSGGVETIRGTSSSTVALTASDAFYDMYINIPTEVALNTTDQIVLKWYAVSANPAGNTTVTMTVGGNADPHISLGVQATELDQIFVPYTGATHHVDLGAKNLQTTGTVKGGNWTLTGSSLEQDASVAADAIIENKDQDKDILIKNNDGGSSETAIQVHGSSGIVSFPQQSSFLATNSATQTLTQNQWNKILFATEVEDTNGEYDAVTNSRYTALTAGKVDFSTNVTLTTTVSGRMITAFIINGTSGTIYATNDNKVLNQYISMRLSMGIVLAVSDYVEVYVYPVSTNATVLNDGQYNFFEGHKVR